MEKNYFKSKLLLILVFCLCALACFYSCDKPDSLEWTTWESDYFEIEYKPLLPPHPYLDEELILRGEMTISFQGGDAYIAIDRLELFDRRNGIIYHPYDPWGKNASYTCDRKNLTLNFSSTVDSFWGQTWTGKVGKTTMNLKIVFGETVRFTKQ
ncbi:MAG: hypothetical protein FWC34_10555 [Bacteroidetes bacterium]|nr:hypothetical protein [Bacteroidota bacterium]MCL2302553.1 hypothetical protein [Lentimicrobiaceae bacterium]